MHHRRLTALALAFALAAPASVFAGPRTGMADAVVADMNRQRAAHGLKPLRINSQLSDAAVDRIADMFSKHYFSHTSPDGIQPWIWVEHRGYDYREFGENLAVGYPSADSVVDSWMHSPAHRANVLSRNFDEIGVAIAPESPTRGFRGPTVVAIYGRR